MIWTGINGAIYYDLMMKDLNHKDFPLGEVLELLTDRVLFPGPLLVGIDGGAGTGKTTFAGWMATKLRECGMAVEIVHVDHFYKAAANWQEEHPTIFDCDWTRLRDQVLIPLRSRRSAQFPLYDWLTDRVEDPMRIDPGCSVLVEGVGATRKELAELFDLRTWLSCPFALRESRMRGRGDFSEEELRFWLDAEERFFASGSPEESAHLVVNSEFSPINGPAGDWQVVRWSPPPAAR